MTPTAPAPRLLAPTLAWLALLALTFVSLLLGRWLHGSPALPWLVAAIVWLKGWLICRCFLEAPLAHPFIRRVLAGFVLAVPVALVLVALFGAEFARWATL